MKNNEAKKGHFEFPDVTLWSRDSEPMKIINESDLLKSRLLRKLGIEQSPLVTSFGVRDGVEIERRQRTMKFLIENSNFRRFILQGVNLGCIDIPLDGQEFLDHFKNSKKNPFWETVKAFCKLIEKSGGSAPAELQKLARFFSSMQPTVESEERVMADALACEIQQATFLSGLFTARFRGGGSRSSLSKVSDFSVYGYQRYSYSLSNRWREYDVDLPDWLTWVEALGNFLIGLFRAKWLYAPLVKLNVPEELKSDVRDFLETLQKVSFQLGDAGRDEVDVRFSYRYDETGLNIRFIDLVFCEKEKSVEQEMEPFLKEQYVGYGAVEMRMLERQARQVAKSIVSTRVLEQVIDARRELRREFPALFSSMVIPSQAMDQQYKWFSLPSIVESSSTFNEDYQKFSSFREYFREHLKTLREMAIIAESLIQKSEEWSAPLAYPVLLSDDTHLISFEGVRPVHLIGEARSSGVIGRKDAVGDAKKEKPVIKARELVPVTALPELNGQMVLLTGQNAGGKTVSLETVAYALWLAQSGLPVFAENFSFNVKGVLGLVFMERGEGSTADLLVNKLKKVLEGIGGMDKKSVLLIVDELGSATQEGERESAVRKATGGYGLGSRFLRTVQQHGCSILFSTQIRTLAEYAGNELGASCFSFTLNHAIVPGIGAGDIELLVERSGLEELLVD